MILVIRWVLVKSQLSVKEDNYLQSKGNDFVETWNLYCLHCMDGNLYYNNTHLYCESRGRRWNAGTPLFGFLFSVASPLPTNLSTLLNTGVSVQTS